MGFTRFRSFDGSQIAWTEYGSGSPTLILCDGIGCAGFVWKYATPLFSKAHRIIHWHYPGHGESSMPPDWDRITISDLAHHLDRVLDAAHVEPPFVLVGHSMGVQVILEYAVKNPTRPHALIPICGSYGHVLDTFHGNGALKAIHPYLQRLTERLPGFTRKVWQAASASSLTYYAAILTELNGDLMTPDDFLPYVEHMRRLDPAGFARMLGKAAEHSVERSLRALATPTLIIAAEHDSFTPYWLSQRMHALLPHSRLVRLPLGSHAAPIELPDHMNLAIEDFLADLKVRATRQPEGAVAREAKHRPREAIPARESCRKSRLNSRGR
jgi:pimeloyl-ACP methyl ester carboxylesterase